MIKGSCLCSEVTYSISGSIGEITHCHCKTCRKAHGTAFSSVAAVQIDEFEFISALLKKHGIKSKVLKDEDIEDIGLTVLMKEADRSDLASEEEVMNKLKG